jgi:hypothetical protein
MSKLTFNKEFRELVLKSYMKEVDEICEQWDWKTNFEPEEIVNLVLTVVEKVIANEHK